MNVSYGKAYFTEHAIVVKGNNYNDTRYLYYLLNKMNLGQYSGQSAQPGLAVNILTGLNAIVPNLSEQSKVSLFMEKTDNIITLHQRKINILKKQKKVYLSTIFPQKEDNIPLLRFSNFQKKWRELQVSDLSKDTIGGGTPRTSKNEYWNGDIPWIQSSDLKEHSVKSVQVNKKITQLGLENSAAKIISKNSLAIVTRVGVGKIALVPFDYTTSQDFLSLRNLNVDTYFSMYSLYYKLQKEVLALQGTSIKGITKKELLKKKLLVPINSHEQRSIGNFLNQLDRDILLHQRRIIKLNIIKKVYLNKIFI